MADRVTLLAHRQVALVVPPRLAPSGAGLLSVRLGLDLEVVGLAPALVDEVPAQIEILLPAGGAVELYEGQFDLLVAGISALLALARAEELCDVIRHAGHYVHELSLPGGMIVRHGSFDEVSGDVHFMPVAEVRPAFVPVLDREGGIQVSVLVLGLGDQVDHSIGGLFELLVRMSRKAVSRGLEPFAHVAVLKDAAEEVAFPPSGGDTEVADGTALCSPGDAVVQRFPLVRNDDFPGKFRQGPPEATFHGHFLQRYGPGFHEPISLLS